MTRALQVAHIDHTSEPGGAELALARLAHAAASDDSWRPLIVIPEDPDGAGAFTDSGDVRHVGPAQPAGASTTNSMLSKAALLGRALRQAIALRRDPQVNDCDIVYANSSRSAVYCILAFQRRIPVVVHLRDIVSRDSLGSMGYALFTRFVLPRASGVVANSHSTKTSAAEHIRVAAPLEVISSPIGLNRAPAPQVNEVVRRVGMVARLDPWKGQDLLIQAFAAAFPSEDITLHLYGGTAFGKEEYLVSLRKLCEDLGVGDRVSFHGHITDVRSAIDSLDICVQSSTRPEPLGQNVLQYLARGKPTVVSGEGGPIEWVRDGVNGMAFSPRDSADLADVLRRLAGDLSTRRHIAANALRTPGLPLDDEIVAATRDLLMRVSRQASEPSDDRALTA